MEQGGVITRGSSPELVLQPAPLGRGYCPARAPGWCGDTGSGQGSSSSLGDLNPEPTKATASLGPHLLSTMWALGSVGRGREKQPGLLTWDGRPVTQRNSSSAHRPLLFPPVRSLPCPAASVMPCVLTDRVRRWRQRHRELLTLQTLVCGGVRAGLPVGRFHESGHGKGTVPGTKGDV